MLLSISFHAICDQLIKEIWGKVEQLQYREKVKYILTNIIREPAISYSPLNSWILNKAID